MKPMVGLAGAMLLGMFAICLAPRSDAQEAMEAGAQEGLTLRERTIVDDTLVRLGDLFVQPLDNPEIPIAEAPAPGETLILDSRKLRHIAEAYGLDWRPVSKLQRVEVTRLSQRITSERIEETVLAAINATARPGGDLRIRLDGAETGFDLPTDVDATMALRDLVYDQSGRHFSAELVAPADGPALVSRRITGSIAELVQVPVPRRLIRAGETMTEEDLDWVWIEIERISSFHLTEAEQVIGQTAKRPLRAGQPMRLTDVAQTAMIKKNGLVRLIVKSGAMTLSVRGRALEDGAFGRAIRVINVDSNRQVIGVVQDASTVAVATDSLAPLN